MLISKTREDLGPLAIPRPRPAAYMVVVAGDVPAGRDERLALVARIETGVDLLFIDEAALLALAAPGRIEAACEWLSRACALSVLCMGREGVVVRRGAEEVFGPACTGFALAPERYADAFLAALARGAPLDACANAAGAAVPAAQDELARVVPKSH